MGLTSWKSGRVQRQDVTIAKNYLGSEEISELNRVVVMFLDFAEDQARRKQPIHLADWQRKLDEFLRFNDRPVLEDAGRVSREDADRKAMEEYGAFSARRRELAEAQGEADAIRALEDAARKGIARRKKPGKRGET